MSNGQSANLVIFGFAINTIPDAPSSSTSMPATPTQPVSLGSAQNSIVPLQTINYYGGAPPSTQFTQSGTHNTIGPTATSGGLQIMPNGSVTYELSVSMGTPVTFAFTLYGWTQQGYDPPQSHVRVYSNKTQIWDNPTFNDTNPVTISVTIDNLKTGNNNITIVNESDSPCTISIVSVSVSSADYTVNASYWWNAVYQTSLGPGGGGSLDTSFSTGVSETNTQTYSYAESIGVEVGAGGIAAALGGISAKLTTTFTATQTSSQSISLTSETTTSYSFDYTNPTNGQAAVQIWQPVLQFEVGGQTQTQYLLPDQGPYIMLTYPATTGSNIVKLREVVAKKANA